MTAAAASVILICLAAYVGAGVIFACAFITIGMGVVDRGAKNAPWGVRVLLFPGACALWPVLAVKWFRSFGGPR